MVAAPRTRVTVDEYLAMERTSSEKHTLWDGEVYAMAGALPDHNAITANVLAELRSVTRRGPCRVFSSDLKVYVPLRKGFVYADASVVCGPLALYDETRDVITNPTVLVEVLSEGTEAFDRGEKATGYRGISTLRDLIFVSQTEPYVEHFARQADGSWLLREYRNDDEVPVATLGGALRLSELYLKVFGA
ncbi:MAG: Uma2 family endonuclease [Polyangiales bacterium]